MANMKFSDAPDFLREYLLYMQNIQGRSERTVQAYYVDLKGFLKYIYALKTNCKNITKDDLQNISLELVTLDMIRSVSRLDVYEYLSYTKNDTHNNEKTRARKISSIRSLFKYLTNNNKLTENPVRNLEMPSQKKSVPKFLSLEESVDLLSAVDGDQAPRDYCIITLFLNCGMRLSELVGINYGDIRGEQLKLLGKGNKERIVYLNEACRDAIAQYEDYKKRMIADHTLKVKDKQAFFLSSRGTRLTARRVQQIVEESLKKSHLSGKGISPHKLRHTAATLMFQQGGVDIRVLKEVLGHANVGTTEIYTHVANAQVRDAINASPLAHFSREIATEHDTATETVEEPKPAPKKRGRPRKHPLPEEE